ncbi:hypothetical protein VCHC17A1_3976B, partial [Vibrio cholerae HC-17A1]
TMGPLENSTSLVYLSNSAMRHNRYSTSLQYHFP